ncbi:MAG TPA: AEC family transporter [Hyphomicrobiaceae bacterium]|nr:AEC family transporter [Hyphomicrobiaceae bacterium]
MTAMVLLALLPVTLLIGLGYLLNRAAFLSEGFWSEAERLCYYILLPALFLYGLATADMAALPVRGLASVLVGSIVAVAALVVAARPLFRMDGAEFTSVFQGSIRFNNYIGVTLAAGMFGAEGIALAAVCNAAIVPTVNLLCVLVFARYGSVRLSAGAAVKQLAVNPLLVSCLAGIAVQALGLGLPPGIGTALKALGAASMPLGLLCVGAALQFGAARQWLAPVVTSSTAKFLVMPVVTFLVGRVLGLSAQTMLVALMFQALPTASSSYIMARQLGGNAPLMAGITATQTVLAVVAIPLVLLMLVR